MMTRGSRWRAGLTTAVVVALLMAACGGEDGTRAPASHVVGDLATAARWANEQGESAPSPASLRPVQAGAFPIVIEVVETGSRFVPYEHFVDDGGVPTRGNFFETDGYLYQRGTLTCTDGTCDGVVYDEQGVPSPEFPDKIIGSWTCYGTEVADAAATMTGGLARPPRCSTWMLWWRAHGRGE
jgi:hypothetical protein